MREPLFSYEKIALVISSYPLIAPAFKKLASKVARGMRLPQTFTVRGLDYDSQRALERLLGTRGDRYPDGRIIIPVHTFLNDAREWVGAIEYFRLSDNNNKPSDIFERLKLLLPQEIKFIDLLAANSEVKRFLNNQEEISEWLHLIQEVINRFRSSPSDATTLSQLGSDWFNDSKKLRVGALRRQMVIALGLLMDENIEDEKDILSKAFIADNPYTSYVTFSAPILLHLEDGTIFDYPLKYYEKHMAVQIPLETLLQLNHIEWKSEKYLVITSENAAPFVRMVRGGECCVYTEGYPSLAVRAFLKKLSDCGVECVHEGDADLDGLCIASEIGQCITIRRTVAADILNNAYDGQGIEFTQSQIKRMNDFIESPRSNGFKYLNELELLIRRKRWIEQESFAFFSFFNTDAK